MEPTKRCAGCGDTKPVSQFHRQKQQADGYRPRCKLCRKAETAAWYVANREDVKARSAKWRADNPERYRAQLKSWAQRNPDLKRKIQRAWYQRTRPIRLAQQLAYQKLHPEQAANQKARRKAQIGATVHPITAAEWAELKAKYRGCCAYCGHEEARPTMDHVVPLKKGGSHTVENIVPACGPCNRAKSTMSVMEFLALRQQGA